MSSSDSTGQSDLAKKIADAGVDPLVSEANSRTTGSTTTVRDEHPEIVRKEKKEEEKVEKLEQEAQPTG